MKPKHVEKSFSCKRCVYKSNIEMKSVFDFCFVWPFSVSSSTSSVNNVSNIKYLSFFFLDQSFPDTGCCNWEIRIGMFPVWFCNFFRSWVPIKIVRCTDVFFFRYKSLWCPMILPGLIYCTGRHRQNTLVGHDIKTHNLNLSILSGHLEINTGQFACVWSYNLNWKSCFFT